MQRWGACPGPWPHHHPGPQPGEAGSQPLSRQAAPRATSQRGGVKPARGKRRNPGPAVPTLGAGQARPKGPHKDAAVPHGRPGPRGRGRGGGLAGAGHRPPPWVGTMVIFDFRLSIFGFRLFHLVSRYSKLDFFVNRPPLPFDCRFLISLTLVGCWPPRLLWRWRLMPIGRRAPASPDGGSAQLSTRDGNATRATSQH